MSTYYYLCCVKCGIRLHLGQGVSGDSVYTGEPEVMEQLTRFLPTHAEHELVYTSEHFCSEPEQGYKDFN